MANRAEAVAFDVLETVLGLDPVEARLEDAGQPSTVLGPFFMRFQRDAMALTRDHANFTRTARQALRTETQQAMAKGATNYVLERSP